MSRCYRWFLRLPAFKGKPMIDRFIKARWYAPRATRITGGLLMWLDPMEWTQATLLADGVLEPMTTRLMRCILSPGDTYIDVGAHVGFHTLAARSVVGGTGRVIAIEPQPYNCERILHNWQLNGFDNLDLFVAAAGGEMGAVVLRQQSATDKARLSLVLDGVNDLPQRFHVPMVTIDGIMDATDAARIDVIKIDVEGYEAEVIAGMRGALGRTSHLIFEMLPGSASGERSRKLIDDLRAHGFDSRSVKGERLDNLEAIPENNVWCTRWSEQQVRQAFGAAQG